METPTARTDTWSIWTPSREQILLVRLVLLATAGFVLVLSGVFLARRLVGAFGQPLPSETLIVLGAVMTTLVAAVRLAWRRVSGSNVIPGRREGLLLDGTLCLGVFCLAASLSVRGTEVAPLVVFWCLLVAGELIGWSTYYRRIAGHIRARGRNRRRHEHTPSTSDGPARELTAAINGTRGLEEPAEDDGFELLSPSVSQRITRGREENGVEAVFGVVRCDFAVGQRQQNLHISFCPPLERIPELTTDQIDGPMVKIKPSMIEVFGAGLEVKLPAPCSEPMSVQVQFYACEKPDDARPPA